MNGYSSGPVTNIIIPLTFQKKFTFYKRHWKYFQVNLQKKVVFFGLF